MKLQPDRADGVNVIHAYTADSVSVNGTTYSHAVLVPHTGDVLPWTAQTWAELNDGHFQAIADARPELVVFGSGAALHFMKPAVLRPLIDARIGRSPPRHRAARPRRTAASSTTKAGEGTR